MHAANEVTRRGRETLDLMCRELAARGVTLLEADTDGVYFAVPEGVDRGGRAPRRRARSRALLPPLVQLEFEGRYAAMLSHEPKNYALLGYDGTLLLRGVAFRSSRAEPFGEAFLRAAIARLLAGDVAGVRDVYLDDGRRAAPRASCRRTTCRRACGSRRRRREYLDDARAPPRAAVRGDARERAARRGASAIACASTARDRRGRGSSTRCSRRRDAARATRATTTSSTTCALLRETFAARLARAFTPDDFAAVFADPDQPSLFQPPISDIHTVLTALPNHRAASTSTIVNTDSTD